MTAALRTVALGAVATATLAATPASAMPVATSSMPSAIVKVSGWATRAEGRRHTYPQPYGYGYAYGYDRGAYGGWGKGGYPGPYGLGYGRAVPPAYGYDAPYGAY